MSCNQSMPSVKLYGATGGGVLDDTAALQGAITAGSCYIPAGTYLVSSSLLVPSNRLIQADQNAIILRVPLAAGNGTGQDLNKGQVLLLQNADYTGGNTNITVIGGKWSCAGSTRGGSGSGGNIPQGTAIRFSNVTKLTLQGMEVIDPVTFGIQIGTSVNTTVRDIRFSYSGALSGNRDGLHINGPANTLFVENLYGQVYDDFVALNADDIGGYQLTAGAITNISIKGLFGSSNFAAVRILSAANSVSGVSIQDILGGSYTSAVYFSGHDAGSTAGVIKDVSISNVRITNTSYLFNFATGSTSRITIDGARLEYSGTSTSVKFVSTTSASTQTVEDLRIVNSSAVYTGLSGSEEIYPFDFQGGGTTWRSISIDNFFEKRSAAGGRAFQFSRPVNYLRVSNSIYELTQNVFLAQSSTANLGTIIFEDCEFRSATHVFNIASSTTIENLVVKGCYFSDMATNGRGLVTGGTCSITRAFFLGNRLREPDSDVYFVSHAAGTIGTLELIGNHIEDTNASNSGRGGQIVGTVTRIILTDNVFKNMSFGWIIFGATVPDIAVKGNFFDDATYGFWIDNGATVGRLTFTNNHGVGLTNLLRHTGAGNGIQIYTDNNATTSVSTPLSLGGTGTFSLIGDDLNYEAIVSGDQTLLTASPKRQIYTGSGNTWTLPDRALSLTVGKEFVISNRGSGAITLNRAGSDNIYEMGTGSVTTVSISAGDTAVITPDSTFFICQII
jgi:hypothetical protein